MLSILLSACTEKDSGEENITDTSYTEQTVKSEINRDEGLVPSEDEGLSPNESEPQLPFGYDRLDEIGREIYDLMASGVLTAESPYIFDAPLSYETVSKPIFLYRYNTINLVPLGGYAPYYMVIFTDEITEQYFDFSYGYTLKAIPPVGDLVPLSGEDGLYTDTGIISGIMLMPLIKNGDPASESMLMRLEEHNTGVPLAAEEWMELLPQTDADDYEKVRALALLMCDKIEYDVCADSDSIYGAVVNNKAQCEGYAKTFCYFANRLGLEALYVSGVANDIGHGWNMVRINGIWYHIDVTWMDNETGIDWTYFLCADETMRQNGHEFSQLNYLIAEMDNNYDPFYRLPECPLDYIETLTDKEK